MHCLLHIAAGPVEEEVFENERFQPFKGWGHGWPGNFLPTDKVGHWSHRNGTPGKAASMAFSTVAPKLPKVSQSSSCFMQVLYPCTIQSLPTVSLLLICASPALISACWQPMSTITVLAGRLSSSSFILETLTSKQAYFRNQLCYLMPLLCAHSFLHVQVDLCPVSYYCRTTAGMVMG